VEERLEFSWWLLFALMELFRQWHLFAPQKLFRWWLPIRGGVQEAHTLGGAKKCAARKWTNEGLRPPLSLLPCTNGWEAGSSPRRQA
jgi:hypothetical protein